MEHPVFYNRRSAFIYLAAWMGITAIQVAIVYFYSVNNLRLAIGDAVVYNMIYAVLGLVVWFPVRFTQAGKKNMVNLLINHLTSLILILLIWGLIGYFVLLNSIPDPEYALFLKRAIPFRIISGVFYYLILVLIYYLIIYYNDLHERQIAEAKLIGNLKEAELNVLKSQINPHFLFNSLNSISSLTITNSEKAREMIIKLSDFLRYTVSMEKTGFSSLEKEIENVRKYLEIEKVRFGNKLQFEFQVEKECLQQELPLMILQPLYENSIKHGVYEADQPVFISTRCSKQENFLQITISNNFEPGPSSRKGAGLGLHNIKERLKLIYQADDLLSISKKERQFTVNLLIPTEIHE